jgi:hypothetical protein
MPIPLEIALALTIGLLTSVVVGGTATFLAWRSGAHPAAAVLRGGVAFGGSMLLWVACMGLFVR